MCSDGKFTITGYSHDSGTCHSISKVRLIGGDPVQTAIETRACEGSSVSLSCDSGFIDIIDATYGRKHGPDVCPHSATSDQDCHAASSVGIVSAACSGQSSCEVSATNGVFGDPCGGTYKYLTVNYACLAGEPPAPPPVGAISPADFATTGSCKVDDSDDSILSVTQVANSQQGTCFMPASVTSGDTIAITYDFFTGDGSGADGAACA